MAQRTKPWQDSAPCIGLSEYFFPEVDEDGNEVGSTEVARSICSECPFKGECLDTAIAERLEYGIAGGMNYRERESFRMFTYRHTKREGFINALEEVAVSIG